MTIGDRIKQRRKLFNISQSELAKKINVTKQTVYKYENNIITNIPSDKIEMIAKILETTPGYLMGWGLSDDIISDIFEFSPHEKKLVTHYRQADELHKAMVDEILNIKQENKRDTLKEA